MPHALPDFLAHLFRGLRFKWAKDMNDSLEVHGLVSSDYLMERVEAGKDLFNGEYRSFMGLQHKYPEVALPLARKIWAEPYTYQRRRRFENAAGIFAYRGDSSELTQLLGDPPRQNDLRRKALLEFLARRNRADVADAIQRIAEDRSAPDRLIAIGALAPFRTPQELMPFWEDFLRTASAEQHSGLAQGVLVPEEYDVRLCEQALADSRTIVLRCWLAGFSFGRDPTLDRRWNLTVRLLELSEHIDLRVRRGALHALAETLNQSTNIPPPWSDSDFFAQWWEKDLKGTEAQAELDQSEHLRNATRNALRATSK
jgi:hypothetical protein